MTATQAVQHPNTEKLVTLAIGALLGLAAQHGIDKDQIATLTQFFSSEEFRTVALAIVVIFKQVKDGLVKPQPLPISQQATGVGKGGMETELPTAAQYAEAVKLLGEQLKEMNIRLQTPPATSVAKPANEAEAMLAALKA